MAEHEPYIENLLAQLETIELKEELHDTYFQNKTLPNMTNTNIIKGAGQLTQDRLNQIAQASANINIGSDVKWTQSLFGTILSQVTRICTFLSANKKVAEEFSNYKKVTWLQEDNVAVDIMTRNRDTLFLRDSNISLAYVLTSVPGIYIGGIKADQYKNFTRSGNNPSTKEGVKVKNFAAANIQTIKSQAVAKLMSKLQSEDDKRILEQVLSTEAINGLLTDVASLATVDLMNLGTLNESYGDTYKAAAALLSNNMLQSIPGVDSLASSRPELSTEISETLSNIMKQRSPYWVEPRRLKVAIRKLNSISDPNAAPINNFAASYMNLTSYVLKCLGDTKSIDLDTLIKVPLDKKKEYLLSLAGTKIYTAVDIDNAVIRNPFIRLASRDMDGFAISPDVMRGFVFQISNDTGSGTDIMKAAPASAKDVKTPVLNNEVQRFLLNQASRRFPSPDNKISAAAFAQTFSEHETKSDSQQNIGQGLRSTKEQLIDLLMFLFDENTQRLRTGEVLFASVPSIIALGAKEDIWVTTKRMTQNVKSCELAILNKQFDAAKLELRPLSELYNEYMDILLSPNPQDKLLYISQSFTTLIPNIFAGFWSHRVLQEKGFTLACFSGIDTTSYYKELKWDERVLLDSGAHILSAREAAISKIQKAKV